MCTPSPLFIIPSFEKISTIEKNSVANATVFIISLISFAVHTLDAAKTKKKAKQQQGYVASNCTRSQWVQHQSYEPIGQQHDLPFFRVQSIISTSKHEAYQNEYGAKHLGD